ncbi:MAG: phospho-N-acetylmuramoyl-pentapeptide-transferase [Clostridiaceae bacterium]|nr:phospho-N-acetylmuramoyl-pentapeptide-transferase [Clostridiaceae bacterium]
MGGEFSISVQVIAFLITFIMALIMGPIMIPILRRLKFGQTIRDDGPSTHLKKMGIPTMGGLIFLIPIIIASFVYFPQYPEIILLAMVTLGFGAAGFIDDFIKVTKKRKDGLYWDQKMLILVAVSVIFVIYSLNAGYLDTNIIVPFMGIDYSFTMPAWLFIPFSVFVLISITNAVNLTDGLDGLAAGVTLIVTVFFTIVAMMKSDWDFIKVFSAIVSGGCLGFLAFNIHPARVFMGDTGSLALGGAVGAISILMGMPWILLVAGFIYVVEALSVIIQVASFKLRRKRVFKMAPVHHHFELSGWKEQKVVLLFWGVTVISCLIGFLSLRIIFF